MGFIGGSKIKISQGHIPLSYTQTGIVNLYGTRFDKLPSKIFLIIQFVCFKKIHLLTVFHSLFGITTAGRQIISQDSVCQVIISLKDRKVITLVCSKPTAIF